MIRHSLILLAIALLGATAHAQQVDEAACGPLRNNYGPFDYRSDKDKLDIVERAHFTPDVENLTAGKSSYLAGDIDYTLRAFPNHHRALMSIYRLGDREKTERPKGSRYSVDCYFERALRFRDNDGTVRMIYAIYLAKKGRSADALKQLSKAEELVGENANLSYNIGLVYTDLHDYENALIYAHKAYAMGFPLPGLREKLKRAGKWRDPAPAPKPEPAPTTEQTAPVAPEKTEK